MFMRVVTGGKFISPFEEHPTEGPHGGVNGSTNDFPSAAVFHCLQEDQVRCGAICEPLCGYR